jgi:hypothetical protein
LAFVNPLEIANACPRNFPTDIMKTFRSEDHEIIPHLEFGDAYFKSLQLQNSHYEAPFSRRIHSRPDSNRSKIPFSPIMRINLKEDGSAGMQNPSKNILITNLSSDHNLIC